MTRGKKDKLKRLLDSVPPNFIVDTPWLGSRQIDYRLAHWYMKSGWLRSVARGVYQRSEVASETDSGPIDWWVIVASIQCLMGYDVHIGGKTALSIQGYRHYLNLGIKEPVYLYGDAPAWLRRIASNRKFITRSRALFRQCGIGVAESNNPQNVNEHYADRHDHSWRSYISLNNVNLGSGPRQTFKGGRIHPKILNLNASNIRR